MRCGLDGYPWDPLSFHCVEGRIRDIVQNVMDPLYRPFSRSGIWHHLLVGAVCCLFSTGIRLKAGETIWPAFWLTNATAALEWTGPHDAVLTATAEGLQFQITGPDPFVQGPARDYPVNQTGWLEVTLRSAQVGNGQIFWFQDGPREPDSIRFSVSTTNWITVKVPTPALGPGFHLRFDPPGESGSCVVRSVVSSPRHLYAEPAWRTPPRLGATNHPLAEVRSGRLTWQQLGGWGENVLLWDGQLVAQGHPRAPWGWVENGQLLWEDPNGTLEKTTVDRSGSGITLQSRASTSSGRTLALQQLITPGREDNTIDVQTTWTAEREIDILFAPLLLIHPREEVFGAEPHQALFAGVEYLENEPSSSERTLRGPQALRRVPEPTKITFPLMAVASDKVWMSLDWTVDDRVAALFDVPDRTWHSGGPVLGLIAPGSAPSLRPDGALLPYEPVHLATGDRLTAEATLSAGSGVLNARPGPFFETEPLSKYTGTTVIPAVQGWVRRHVPPRAEGTKERAAVTDFLDVAAHGWLDSRLRHGNRFSHAVGSNFGAQPAADAALWMDWLSTRVHEPGLADRLRTASSAALAEVPVNAWHASQIGHIRQPLIPLVYGHVAENLVALQEEARQWVQRLGTNGVMAYSPPVGHVDLSETHGSREVNGLVSKPIQTILQAAFITGDPGLREDGLRLLRTLDRWKFGVPRGAQSWEVPLHAPDILASAQLADIYRLGAVLSNNDPALLREAEYWAWTGIPFVRLQATGFDPVGYFATTPVLGATEYVAPNWIGLPVQWCGLVYARTLLDLADVSGNKDWYPMARGIAWSGVRQSHTRDDPGLIGLLPDSFDLKAQVRNPVPINPATLLPGVADYLGQPAFCSRALGSGSMVSVHAPGAVSQLAPLYDTKGVCTGMRLDVRAWPAHPWWLLVSGLQHQPRVEVDGRSYSQLSGTEWIPEHGWLILGQTEPSIKVTIWF